MEGREEDRGTNTLPTWRPEGDGWLVDDGEEGSVVLGYVECEGKLLSYEGSDTLFMDKPAEYIHSILVENLCQLLPGGVVGYDIPPAW